MCATPTSPHPSPRSQQSSFHSTRLLWLRPSLLYAHFFRNSFLLVWCYFYPYNNAYVVTINLWYCLNCIDATSEIIISHYANLKDKDSCKSPIKYTWYLQNKIMVKNSLNEEQVVVQISRGLLDLTHLLPASRMCDGKRCFLYVKPSLFYIIM